MIDKELHCIDEAEIIHIKVSDMYYLQLQLTHAHMHVIGTPIVDMGHTHTQSS